MAKQTKAPPARAVERFTLAAKTGGAAERNPGAARHEALAEAEAKAAARADGEVKPETKESGNVGDA